MKLEDIMVKKVITVSSLETVVEAAKKMREANVGCLVVNDDRNVKGMLTDRDLVVGCLGAGHNARECRVAQHMSSPVIIAEPGWDILEASRVMTEQQVKRLPVMQDKKLVGLVSFSDIALALDKPMHELLVGADATRRALLKYI
ncbi:MAG: CBS protein [Dehalococcoidia bacterium]|nr:CBS protein [Dehalococcoidia bacterium]